MAKQGGNRQGGRGGSAGGRANGGGALGAAGVSASKGAGRIVKAQPQKHNGHSGSASAVNKRVASSAAKLVRRGGDDSDDEADDDDVKAKPSRREIVSLQSSHDDGGNDDDDEDDDLDDSDFDSDEDDDEDEGDEDELDEQDSAQRSRLSDLAAAASSSGRKALLMRHIQEELDQHMGEAEDDEEADEEAADEDADMDGDDQDGEEDEEDEDVDASLAALAAASKKSSSDRVPRNKQRVLLVASRGITHRYRHLMNDFHVLLPHSKKDSKLDSKSHLEDLNELAELSNCNNCLYFEVRRHQDTFLWMSRTPNGPSVKFMVRNIHTMDELKMTGNCLKGSRPILSFDSVFSTEPHLLLLQEMFTQTFGVPKTSRKIKPFIDHVMSFSVVDNKIWIRNFQIIEKNPEKGAKSKDKPITLVEIGPRCVLDVIRIFDGSFGGSTLFENPHYISPNDVRRTIKAKINEQHRARLQSQVQRDQKKILNQMAPDPLADVFA